MCRMKGMREETFHDRPHGGETFRALVVVLDCVVARKPEGQSLRLGSFKAGELIQRGD